MIENLPEVTTISNIDDTQVIFFYHVLYGELKGFSLLEIKKLLEA